jgi:hypothetical protein
MDAVLRGQAGPEAEELADARLGGQEADYATDERPVVADDPRDVREGGKQLLRGLPAGGEVVLSPQLGSAYFPSIHTRAVFATGAGFFDVRSLSLGHHPG